ncbi:MAG: acetate kinase [Candidatus Sumerlaeota bacterium]|nr:acetate kinase [Candidatus Sumerlaeota bacterium]
MPGEKERLAGEAQRVGTKTAEPPRIVYRVDGVEKVHQADMPSQEAALREVMGLLDSLDGMTPDLLGHRMVHGGQRFTTPAAKVDAKALVDLDAVAGLAPIHNPPAIRVVRACHDSFPGLPQFLVFDTAYHSTIPDYAANYALPKYMREDMGLRKYGFHGTSHQFVAQEAATMLGKPMEEFNAVSCHLGSGGASLCAIINGKSVDNTMGYSPLQGLVMSTRSGDMDPAVVLSLVSTRGGDATAVEQYLNKKAGVLGLSGVSSDIRDVIVHSREETEEGERAKLALHVYLWRLRKYLGAYLTVVGRADAVLFTDTIGELVPYVRGAVCEGMEAFGIAADSGLNEAATGDALPADFASAASSVHLLAIRTNEELSIARQAFALAAKAA